MKALGKDKQKTEMMKKDMHKKGPNKEIKSAISKALMTPSTDLNIEKGERERETHTHRS